MIQVKEFLDTHNSSAEKKTNDFLATLRDDQLIDIKYSTGMKTFGTTTEQRSYILVIYKADPPSK
ncbi:Protein of uncharacterised function (DUF2758) [Chlamydia abortus]|jgi:site-specific recombinase XerD|uniref:Sporulation protein Cse60 n=1 Tax=Paenibacillus residui TaxID=629724 RepID=A0ABW3D7T5_9BACL|nr:sporulation protein Cse60 [Paenibacillus sp. 32O-W]SHE11248.1 Protein of uncharacterised function (DUF2758) [Chlamydia abortus]